jgi:hypothetical protein
MACQNCGATTTARKLFCATACRDGFYNRMSKRGRVVVPLLLAWRAGRGSGRSSKAAFAELCAYADHCNAEDRASGRPPMAELVGWRDQHGTGVGWRERVTTTA